MRIKSMSTAAAACALTVFVLCAEAGAVPCPKDEDGLAAEMLVQRCLDFIRTSGSNQRVAVARCAEDVYELVVSKGVRLHELSRSETFLDEAADVQHAAAVFHRENDAVGGEQFFDAEIDMRKALFELCKDDPDSCGRFDYNFIALLQAFDWVQRGSDANAWMLDHGIERLRSTKALRLWLKALYSCPKWDMRPAVEPDEFYRGDDLCSPGCADLTIAAGEALRGAVLAASVKAMAARFVRLAESCAATGSGAEGDEPREGEQ